MKYKLTDLEKDYFSENFKPKYWHSVHECWFLNGNSPRWKIRFFKEEIYRVFFVSVFKEGKEIEDITDSTINGSWDILLVKVFDVYFSVRRVDQGFVLFYKSMGNGEDQYGVAMSSVLIKKNIIESFDDPLFSPSEGKCKNLQIYNKAIIISQKEELIESSSCRLFLICILAYSYVSKLDFYVRKISKEINHANKMYEEMQVWKTKYMYSVPIYINRVVELSLMWDDLSSFFRIDLLIKEMENKLKEISVLSNSSKLDKLNRRMLFLTVIATLSAFISTALTIYDRFFR